MYLCPHCQSRLKASQVLIAGPLGYRRCPSCEGGYFGGGLPVAFAVLNGSLVLNLVVDVWQGRPSLALFAAGAVASFWVLFKARPRPAEKRWREVGKVAAVVAGFGVLFLLARPAVKALLAWVGT